MARPSESDYRGNPLGTLREAIRTWKPRDPTDGRLALPQTEHRWKESLRAHLTSLLPWARVYVEGGAGRQHGDVVIEYQEGMIFKKNHRDFVELKAGLNTGNVHDLIGKLEGYLKEQTFTVGVVCGPKTDQDLLKRLEIHFASRKGKLAVFWKPGSEVGIRDTVFDPWLKTK